jgi:phage terminase large subunit
MLDQYGIEYKHNKSEQILRVKDSVVFFKSIDDQEKIKSSEYNYIWMEEATDFDVEDFMQCNLRLRRQNTNSGMINQIFLTFNPISQANWVFNTFFQNSKYDADVLHTTYKDNPFIDEVYSKELEHLIETDENFYKVYALGEFAALGDNVYSNYEITSVIPSKFDEVFAGLDFGWNHPMAFVKVGIKDGLHYIIEEIYESNMTTGQFGNLMKERGVLFNLPIYADKAEPDRIRELNKMGFNVIKADKAVGAGLDFCKQQKIIINSECINTIKEIKSYSYKKVNGITTEEPVKFLDDAMDAMRYAMFTHYKTRGFKSKVKRVVFGKRRF